jgi:hypothetical protein
MARVYLETSFFSMCVTSRTADLDIGRRASSKLWWKTQAKHHELFISSEVVRELSAPVFPNRDQALAMLSGLTVLEFTAEVVDLAEVLVRERAMPAPAIEGDALHLAVAIIHQMEYVLTWNVKHLANPNKRTHLAVLCMRLGLTPRQLATPDLLQEFNDD